jgi:hypothetical protein
VQHNNGTSKKIYQQDGAPVDREEFDRNGFDALLEQEQEEAKPAEQEPVAQEAFVENLNPFGEDSDVEDSAMEDLHLKEKGKNSEKQQEAGANPIDIGGVPT